MTEPLDASTLNSVNSNDSDARVVGSAYKIQVLDRAFSLLDALAGADRPQSLRQLSGAADLHKSTTHRLLLILERYGFVERAVTPGEYRLGSKLLQLGMRFAAGLDVRERAQPFLSKLVEETGETAHVGVLRQGQAISIAHCEARHTLRIAASVGRAWPAYCSALGKAILAFLPDLELEDVLANTEYRAFTRKTITSARSLRLALRTIRKTGLAIDDGEYEDGLMCIGAPIFDSMGRVIASLAIEGPMSRLGKSRMASLTESVARAAADVSASMGFLGARVALGNSTPDSRRKSKAVGD